MNNAVQFVVCGTRDTYARVDRMYAAAAPGPDRRFLGSAESVMRALKHWNPESGFFGVFAEAAEEWIGFASGAVTKRSVGKWGVYFRLDYVHVQPARRGAGLGKALVVAAKAQAAQRGAGRIRVLVGSRSGFELQRALGHTFWGLDKKGQLIVDHPLALEHAIDGTPPTVLAKCPSAHHPLPPEEALELFRTRGLGKGAV